MSADAARRERQAMPLAAMCLVITVGSVVGAICMAVSNDLVALVLFLGLFLLSLVLGCVLRETFQLFDTDTFGDPR